MRSEIPGNITGMVGGIPRCDITASIITVLEEVLGMPPWHPPIPPPLRLCGSVVVSELLPGDDDEDDDDAGDGITSAHRITWWTVLSLDLKITRTCRLPSGSSSSIRPLLFSSLAEQILMEITKG